MAYSDSGDLFERAKAAADIVDVAGVKMARAGAMMRGPCPVSGCGAKSKGWNGPFVVDPKEKWFKCWSCGEKGDVIELEHRLRGRAGETTADACRRILGDAPTAPVQVRARPVKIVAPDESHSNWKVELAARLWREGVPAAGTLVERYMGCRDMFGPPLEAALKRLRFHPAAYHHRDGRDVVAFPAILEIVHAPSGPTGGIQAIYLNHDGRKKAETGDRPNKIMWGPQSRDGAYGGVWLTHPENPGPLIVAEGLETVVSLACLGAWPCRMVAALALDRLQGGWMAVDGISDPDCPRPDLNSPAFTWPEAPAVPWGEVRIGIDSDMKPIRKTIAGAMNTRATVMIDSAARARVCGTLASFWWQRATKAPVRTLFAPPGMDFNDVLRAQCSK